MNAMIIIIIFFVGLATFALLIHKKYETDLKYIFFAFIFSFAAVQVSIFIQGLLYFIFTSVLQTNILANINSTKKIFFDSFISAGFTEESIKILFFYLFAKLISKIKKLNSLYKTESINSKDLFLLAIFYGLVFASFENIAYFIQDIDSIKIRIFTASIFHATISIYYWKFYLKQNKFIMIIFAIFLHGLYNLFLSMNIYFSIFSVIINIFLIVKTYENYKNIS